MWTSNVPGTSPNMWEPPRTCRERRRLVSRATPAPRRARSHAGNDLARCQVSPLATIGEGRHFY